MADTVLLIHGYGCGGDVWDPVAGRLRAEGYRVEAPTIRSAVRTIEGPRAGLAGLTLADYVAEMSALAQTLAKETGSKPIVIGHSMGGLIAQKIAEAGHAAAVVLFAPASPADARGKPKLSPVFTFLNLALSSKPETKAGKMWKPGFKFGVVNAVPAARHDELYSKMVYDSGQVLADLAWPDKDPNKTAHVDASKVTVPLLVLAGALDRTTPVEDVRRVGKKYAGAEYKEYPHNAHYLIDEPNTMKILDDLIAWLSGKKQTQAPAPTPAPAPAPTPAPAPAPVAKAPEPAPAPEPVKAPEPTPAPAAAAPEPKPAPAPAPKKAAAPKAAAPKPTAKPKAAPAPKAEAKPKAPAKAPAKAKAAPAAEKAAPAPKAAAPKKAAAAAAKAPAKPAEAPKAAAKPKAAPKAAPAPKAAAVAKPAAKAPAKAAAAPKAAAPKAAATPKAAEPKPAAKAPAKPKAEAAAKPAAAKAPAAKKPATKAPAKTSPKAAK